MTTSHGSSASAPSGSKGLGIILALLVFVVLLFVFIGRSGETKVGVKELKVAVLDKESVDKIEVTLPPKSAPPDAGPAESAKSIVLQKTAGAWQVFDPTAADKKFNVDDSQIKSVLDAAGDFATGDLIANKKAKHAELEIDEAKGHSIKVYAKGKQVLDLVFGRPAKGGGSTVRTAGSDDVFVAKGRLGSVLKKELSAWRKKTMFDVKAEDITRVSIALPDATAPADAPAVRKIAVEGTLPPPALPPPDGGPAAAPAKTEWALTEPVLPAGFRIDKSQLGRLATSLAALRAQDFADGVSDAAAGFTAPHGVIEAATKDGKKLVLHIGGEDDKKRVYARVDGDAQTYLLAAYSAKQLQKSLDDLRELTLLDAKIDDIEKVTIKNYGATYVLNKNGADWQLLEPKKPPADFDAGQIAGQVAGLLRTRAVRVAADAPKTAFTPMVTGPVVELQLAGGKKQQLTFGAALPVADDGKVKDAKAKPVEAREYYVKGGIDDLTYVIAAFTRNRYAKPAELFKKPAEPPPGMGAAGGMSGMENLPPDIRKKLEESMKKGNMPGGHP